MCRNLKFIHIWYVRCTKCLNICRFAVKSIFVQFTHFCRKICFVAIYTILCGEKLNKNCPYGENMINIKYAHICHMDKYQVFIHTRSHTHTHSTCRTMVLHPSQMCYFTWCPRWTSTFHKRHFRCLDLVCL